VSHKTGGERDVPIAIIGGGITGLTLALNLHKRGIDCQVYEAAPDFPRKRCTAARV
jgi:2-polyprenyl-6-methoxyphenol hydroxylase-like FAD-dependent oxidoreductase